MKIIHESQVEEKSIPGRYIRWIATQDTLQPRYLSSCVIRVGKVTERRAHWMSSFRPAAIPRRCSTIVFHEIFRPDGGAGGATGR